MDYCNVFISCLDAHSDGTHSLQMSHWWTGDVMQFLQICSDEETNSSTSRMAWGWVHSQQISFFQKLRLRLLFKQPHAVPNYFFFFLQMQIQKKKKTRRENSLHNHIALVCTRRLKFTVYNTFFYCVFFFWKKKTAWTFFRVPPLVFHSKNNSLQNQIDMK